MQLDVVVDLEGSREHDGPEASGQTELGTGQTSTVPKVMRAAEQGMVGPRPGSAFRSNDARGTRSPSICPPQGTVNCGTTRVLALIATDQKGRAHVRGAVVRHHRRDLHPDAADGTAHRCADLGCARRVPNRPERRGWNRFLRAL